MTCVNFIKDGKMVVFAFFSAVFSSAVWLIYSMMFVNAKLIGSSLWEQSSQNMLIMLAIVFVPVLVVWAVFGYINQFLTNRGMYKKQGELLKQLQKNQDYTDLVVRVMLDAEHEIKDGFVLNKFDVFINDMNEALGEIILRCNIASSMQIDQLWQRVKRGEKWTLGKAILEASKNQSTFNAWVKEKVGRDNVFRGSLLEFCSRYQNLLQLLEKHDRDRVFLRMIETGVFGKVYSIIAPLSEGLDGSSVNRREKVSDVKQSSTDYAAVLKIATIEEPEAEQTIINVDQNDEQDEQEIVSRPKTSFFSKFNPFRRKNEDLYMPTDEQDPFFQALQNSFKNNEVNSVKEETFAPSLDEVKNEPTFTEDNISSPELSAHKAFGGIEDALANLRMESAEPKMETVVSDAVGGDTNASLGEKSNEKVKDEEDVIYPFGGWTDEDKYNQ